MTVPNSLIVLLCAVGIVACSDPQGTQAADSVCDEAIAHMQRCGGPAALTPGQPCEGDQLGAARALLSMSCDEFESPGDPAKEDFWESGNPLCVFMIPVTDLPDGEMCCFDSNCTDGRACVDFRCGLQSAEGAACQRKGHCIEGLVCGPNQSCVPPSPAGGACITPIHCEGRLTCIARVCGDRSSIGGACDAGENKDCAYGLRCLEGVCAPRAASGEACGDNEACDTQLTCVGGTCQSWGGPGEACDLGDRDDCASPLHCILGRCAEDPGEGDPCERSSRSVCGRELTCWENICSPRHGVGEHCETPSDCAEDLYCFSGSCR